MTSVLTQEMMFIPRRDFADLEQCSQHLVDVSSFAGIGSVNNETALALTLPMTFSLERNAACQYNKDFGIWFREACDREAGTLATTLYVDNLCRRRVQRATKHALAAKLPALGTCVPQVGPNNEIQGYRTQYCHN